jgi:hypothetical protein
MKAVPHPYHGSIVYCIAFQTRMHPFDPVLNIRSKPGGGETFARLLLIKPDCTVKKRMVYGCGIFVFISNCYPQFFELTRITLCRYYERLLAP